MNIKDLEKLSLENKQKLALLLFKDKDRIEIFTYVKNHKDDNIEDIKKLLCKKEEENEKKKKKMKKKKKKMKKKKKKMKKKKRTIYLSNYENRKK